MYYDSIENKHGLINQPLIVGLINTDFLFKKHRFFVYKHSCV